MSNQTSLSTVKVCTMNCGPAAGDTRSRDEFMAGCEDCTDWPIRPAATANCGWISVDDRMPDDDTLVLLALSDEEVWPGFRDGEVWRYVDATPIESALVTDWMNLPAAPKRRAA